MLEVLTRWTLPSGINTHSVMYFSESVGLASARADVNAMLQTVASRFATGVSWTVEPEARTIEAGNGQMTGVVTDPTGQVGAGTGAGLFVPDAAQVLLTWQTGRVIDGRFVQGRTYLPGLDANLLVNGNLYSGAQADFASAANALAASASGFGVWHRPKGGTGGSHVPTTGGGCNTELAVLRRRRNR